MNIVIFTDTYLPHIDGVAISVDHFTRLLSGRGHRFIICCPRYGKSDPDPAVENIQVLRFKSASLPSYPDVKIVLPSHKRIRKAMMDFQPDLVHIQTPGPMGNYGVLASRMYDVPLCGTYHTLVSEQGTYISFYRLLKVDKLLSYFKSRKKIKKRLEQVERKNARNLKKKVILRLTNRLYEFGSVIISPSHLIKEELERNGVKKPVEVVSNGMDLALFTRKVKEAPGNAPRLLHVGRISYEKNCEVVLKAFAMILEEFPDATLSIVGDGPALTAMKIEARQLGVDDRVTFPGFIPHETLPAIYPQYDLFLTASTMETQGLVVLEAIASGLPCVGVDAYALPELIQNGRNGFIGEPFDHPAMARSAIRILKDPDLYRNFSREGIEIAEGHALEACADRLEEVYRQVAAEAKIKRLEEPQSEESETVMEKTTE